MRILDSAGVKLGIEALGYEPDQQKSLLHAIEPPVRHDPGHRPDGQRQDGVALHLPQHPEPAGHQHLDRRGPGGNPAARRQPGQRQRQGGPHLRRRRCKSFLRQDPDIIMVGEIRDLETADIAIKAAQTGHLVLSTLHTNDAPATLMRLANMGVAPFNIASSRHPDHRAAARPQAVHALQEARGHPARGAAAAPASREEDLDGSWQAYGPVGCDHCKGTGYKGRVGIYEVMPITDDMRQIIMRNGNALDIAAQAQKEGVRNLRQSGLLKVKQASPRSRKSKPSPTSDARRNRNHHGHRNRTTRAAAQGRQGIHLPLGRHRPQQPPGARRDEGARPRRSSRPTCGGRASASPRSSGRRSAAAARSTRRTSRSSRASSRRC